MNGAHNLCQFLRDVHMRANRIANGWQPIVCMIYASARPESVVSANRVTAGYLKHGEATPRIHKKPPPAPCAVEKPTVSESMRSSATFVVFNLRVKLGVATWS